jgi:shikimate kinase
MGTTEAKRNIVLTGFMATGKTSVGRLLAARLGYDFVDLDTWIEAEAGMTVPQIFATHGEPAFREVEARMVQRAAGRTGCVVATGGGAILNPGNLDALRRSGTVVALTATPETILSRIGSVEDRPMLRGGEKRDRVRLLLKERAPAYAKADLTVDTSARTVEEVADHLLELLARHRVRSRE